MTATTSTAGPVNAPRTVHAKDLLKAAVGPAAEVSCGPGRPTRPERRRSIAERLALRTGPATATGCLPWLGAQDGHGYGKIKDPERGPRRAHVVAYELAHGPVPQGLQLDHVCHDPQQCVGGKTCPHRACVNAAHLQAVSSRVNTLRGNSPAAQAAAATSCARGHEYTSASTYQRPNGARECRTCRRERRARVSA